MNSIEHTAFSAQPAWAKANPEASKLNEPHAKVTQDEQPTETQQPQWVNVNNAVSQIQGFSQRSERSLEFQVDDASGQTVIRVYDKQSEELIRQIPGELALKLAERLNDDEPSLLFSAQV